jgi:hypothetical protein
LTSHSSELDGSLKMLGINIALVQYTGTWLVSENEIILTERK